MRRFQYFLIRFHWQLERSCAKCITKKVFMHHYVVPRSTLIPEKWNYGLVLQRDNRHVDGCMSFPRHAINIPFCAFVSHRHWCDVLNTTNDGDDLTWNTCIISSRCRCIHFDFICYWSVKNVNRLHAMKMVESLRFTDVYSIHIKQTQSSPITNVAAENTHCMVDGENVIYWPVWIATPKLIRAYGQRESIFFGDHLML